VSAARHTPGPWVAKTRTTPFGQAWTVEGPGWRAGDYTASERAAKQKAHELNQAWLDAGGPDLLAACKDARDFLTPDSIKKSVSLAGGSDASAVRRMLHSAILKAEGGSK
jgi:hypothetical protein